MIHPGAQAVYETLLKVHGWVSDRRQDEMHDGTPRIPEWIDDDIMDALDCFAGWCSQEYSLQHMVDSSKSFVKKDSA
jgi:hypothetical protein